MSARRPWAWPLVPAYATVLQAKAWMRSTGWLAEKKLQWPVVSVGSLSAGGAGKTPVVIALAAMLQQRRWRVDVLSRGYGRTGSDVAKVLPNAPDAARRFGDEPVLIARRAGVDVWVGADRFAAGVEAEAHEDNTLRDDNPSETPRVHLLDDGFQHRILARKVDVVLVTAEDFVDELLPAGNRREPMTALGRADFVAVREEEMEVITPLLPKLLHPGALIWTLRRSLSFPAPLFVFGAGLRPVAFCAIARPEGFARMLIESGCGIVETVFFGDHHAYSMADIDRIVEVAKGLNATGLVTTEKDAVKLSSTMRERLESVGPLMIAGLNVEFVFPERVMRELEARLA